MDKEMLPRWGWLLLGLFVMATTASVFNFLVFERADLRGDYEVITIITAMAPVLIYVGVWYDEERQQYWEHARAHIAGDLLFIVVGAALGSAVAVVSVINYGLPRFAQDVIAMAAGFMLSWGLFWWRNPDLYRRSSGG